MIHYELDGTGPGLAPEMEPHLGRPFPASDAILVCSFGLDTVATRTGGQLCAALVEAGFGAHAARHLVRVSPLLRRLSRGRYQLRPFGH